MWLEVQTRLVALCCRAWERVAAGGLESAAAAAAAATVPWCVALVWEGYLAAPLHSCARSVSGMSWPSRYHSTG